MERWSIRTSRRPWQFARRIVGAWATGDAAYTNFPFNLRQPALALLLLAVPQADANVSKHGRPSSSPIFARPWRRSSCPTKSAQIFCPASRRPRRIASKPAPIVTSPMPLSPCEKPAPQTVPQRSGRAPPGDHVALEKSDGGCALQAAKKSSTSLKLPLRRPDRAARGDRPGSSNLQ